MIECYYIICNEDDLYYNELPTLRYLRWKSPLRIRAIMRRENHGRN